MDRSMIPTLSFFALLFVGCGGEESVREPPLNRDFPFGFIRYSILP
jgi:hypothetical protein